VLVVTRIVAVEHGVACDDERASQRVNVGRDADAPSMRNCSSRAIQRWVV
jgi:hypothetical protein